MSGSGYGLLYLEFNGAFHVDIYFTFSYMKDWIILPISDKNGLLCMY